MAGQLLRPMAGGGVLARFGDLVLLCAAAEERHGPQIAELLDLVRGVADRGGDGRRLSRRLAGLLLSDEDDPVEYPSLAVIGPLDDGLAVFVHGGAVVEVEVAGGVERLDGAQTVTWVDRRIAGPIGGVRATLAGEPGVLDAWCRLGSGIVRASGFLLTSGPHDPLQAAEEPSVEETRVPEPRAWSEDGGRGALSPIELPRAESRHRGENLTGHGALDAAIALAPLRLPQPVAADEVRHVNGSAEPEVGRRLTLLRAPEPSDLVTGCFCENGHFNSALDSHCRDCSVSLTQPPDRTVTGPRPVLGVLAVDGGPRLPIDGAYVVGRDPGADDDVDAGRAKALRLTDIDGRIAAVHARIEPHDWEIHVIDLGTPGGTHMCPPDGTEWSRVMPQVPTAIALGSKVLFGRTGVRFEPVA